MQVQRFLVAIIAATTIFYAAPASAQFYFQSRDLSAAPVTGAEPGIVGQLLPDATPEELDAALLWNLRAALNVAALQCQFAPTLLTVENYNGLVTSRSDEFKDSYDRLGSYFMRTARSRKEGQTALDQYGTRVYSGFSTVRAQLTFCETAAEVGADARFAPRGQLVAFARNRMQELRNSLVAHGEQQFPGYALQPRGVPDFTNDKCWRGSRYNSRRCGSL